jgi:hypothetical protein
MRVPTMVGPRDGSWGLGMFSSMPLFLEDAKAGQLLYWGKCPEGTSLFIQATWYAFVRVGYKQRPIRRSPKHPQGPFR